jgi:hypothetical protein
MRAEGNSKVQHASTHASAFRSLARSVQFLSKLGGSKKTKGEKEKIDLL